MQGIEGHQGAKRIKVFKAQEDLKGTCNDGTGLKLKVFVLGQTYNHGDGVFSKSSKDNHDSMYIAERTFNATKEPRFDMDSETAEFHAPRGVDGMKGIKARKARKVRQVQLEYKVKTARRVRGHTWCAR